MDRKTKDSLFVRKARIRVTGHDDLQVKRGLSPIELSIIIGTICIFFIGGAYFFKVTSKSAYDITAKHDLQEFADFQNFYFKLNKRCIGEQGQSIRNDGVQSDLVIDNFKISEGVSIMIVAGDPLNPYDETNPLTFQAKHEKSDRFFELDFTTGKLTER